METIVRKALPSDIPFIYSTWLKSYYCDSVVGKSCRKSVFFDAYKLVIDEILQRPACKAAAVCDAAEPSVIYSYIVYEPATIHFCYTKEAFRGMGLVRRLVDSAQLPCQPRFPSNPANIHNINDGIDLANANAGPNSPPARPVPAPSPARIEPSSQGTRGYVIVCTHKTFGSSKIFAKYADLLVYNPFGLYKGVPNEQSPR